MKEINVDSHSVPATARSKNYQTAQATTASSGGGSTSPSVAPTTGGAADTAKVAQNLAEDSTDWAKILRKDIDERTENALSIGKNLTVDGQAILNDVVANTGTFAGLLKAASATITGALLASTVSATTINATTFIGELVGNAATATKLKTARTIWGQSFDGSGDVNGPINIKSSTALYQFSADGGTLYAYMGHDPRGFNQVYNGVSNESIRLDDLGGISLLGNTNVDGSFKVSNGGIFYGNITPPTGLGAYVLNYVSPTYGPRVTAYDGTNYQKLSVGRLISGTTFQLELNADGTSKFNGGLISNGVESSKGGIFFGQNATMPTGLGTYVANYTSDAYGARVLAFDGAAYKDLKLGAMPTVGVFGMSLLANGDTRVGYNIGTSNFVSRTTGWNVNNSGAADFRNLYADELRVQAFTADISQALAGSDYLTKSVSKLSSNFVVPSVNSTVRIIVDDIEGAPSTQCFANNDYIRFRAFNRTSGLTIANVWGTVTLDTSYGSGGYLNGTQAYAFTCKATSGAGLTVFKGSEVLDYGTSGSGMISRTTLDAMGSPYEQIATWIDDPSNSTNYTVHARLGDLNGIANCNGYGVYTDNGFFTGNVVIGDLTKNANFLSFDQVNGLQIKLGGTSVATTADVSNAQSTAVSTAATNAAALYVAQSTYNSYVAVTNSAIQAKVSQTDFNALGTRVGTAESTITQHSTDIASKVAQTDFNTLTGRVSTAESGITQNANSIAAKVSSTDYTGATIASLINQSASTVAISAQHIDLIGAVTASSIVSGAVTTDKLAAKAATIDKIDTASLTAAQAFIDDFNANIVTTKKLNVAKIVADGIAAQTIDAQSATINNLSVNNGTIYNLRGPWTDAPLNLTSAQSDNMVMPGNGVGSYHLYSLEWTVNHIGRKITLAGPEGLENGRRYGGGYMQAPSGKYFYVNGNKKTELYVENQIIELIGYGRNGVFYGWIVTNMTPLMDTVNYGNVQRVLVQGRVVGSATDADIVAEHIFNNGSGMSASRISQGIYRVYFPTQWGLGVNYMVMLTGYGHAAEDTGSVFSPIKATLKTISDGYFEVATSDDATVNDGSFQFQLIALNEVNY